jgi:hypothetical protein
VIAGHNISTLGDLVEYLKGNKHAIDVLPTRNWDGTVPLISARTVDATEMYFADCLP